MEMKARMQAAFKEPIPGKVKVRGPWITPADFPPPLTDDERRRARNKRKAARKNKG